MRFHAGGPDDEAGRRGPGGRHHGGGRGRGDSEDAHIRRRQRRLGADELRLLLLHLIAEQPRHGYDLIRAIDELTGGAYAPSPGMIYPTLNLIEEMGHILGSSEGARKIYAVTADGKAELAQQAEPIAAIVGRLKMLGDRHAQSERSPIRRAMQNLKTVLMNRTPDDAASAHEIAAIIDEVAQRIERL